MYAAASNVNSAPNISVQGTISWNTAYNGGGIYANNDINAYILINISSIEGGNTSAGYILHNTARRDSTHNVGYYGYGGGIFIWGYVAFAMWKDSQVNNNTAHGNGGGIYARDVQGCFIISTYRKKEVTSDGTIYSANSGPISLRRPQVCGNKSSLNGSGSGIYIYNTKYSMLCDIDMYDNTSSATTTYQMYCYSSSQTIAINICGITSIVGNIRIGGNSSYGNYIHGDFRNDRQENIIDQYFAYNGWIGNVKKDAIPEYDGTTSITTLFNNYRLNISYLEKITISAVNGFTGKVIVQWWNTYYIMGLSYRATVDNNGCWINGAYYDDSGGKSYFMSNS